MTKLMCIGGAHWDFVKKSPKPLMPHASNIVTTSCRPGGVSLNTAKAAFRAGLAQNVILAGFQSAYQISALPDIGLQDDIHGERVTLPQYWHKINSHHHNPNYIALLDHDNQLIYGLADMALYDHIHASDLMTAWQETGQAPYIFFDSNLPQKALEEWLLILPKHVKLFAAAVSPEKITRLKNCLPRLNGLFLNRLEAKSLLGEIAEGTAGLKQAISHLSAFGLTHIAITDGPHGTCLKSGDDIIEASSPMAADEQIVTVNGAGDAFAGGLLAGWSRQLSSKDCLHLAQQQARYILSGQDQIETIADM